MPELPEVEAARRAVEEHCVGKSIKRAVVADDSKVIDGVSPEDFQASLLGKTIVSARRKGKNMWLELDSPPFPSFQFGMAGAIYIKGVAVTKYKRSAVNDTDEWPSKYSKFFIELEDGLELSFTDKRRFAKVRLLKDPAAVPPISELGPDALLEPMTVDKFISFLSKKEIAIKALLLDQHCVAGIGNWIADEVLYQAKIHPLQIAASLSQENCIALHKSIKEVICYAVEVDADCSYFPLEWLFHFRWGKKPGQVIEKSIEVGADSSQYPSNWIFHSREKKPGKAFVDGKKIEFISARGRTTAYVPELQKLSGTQAAKSSGKSRKQASKKDKDVEGEDAVDEPGDEEEEITAGAKSKKRQNTTRGKGKKPPAKRKAKDGDAGDEDDDVDDNDNDQKKISKVKNATRGGGRKPPPKKSKGRDNDEDDGDDDGNSDDQKETTRKVAKMKESKMEKTSRKNVETSQAARRVKRKK
ncbi:formamidopyrimidine-DNA glycosylase isoform X4 [Malania oleifera]|uniref:formamidopyrimidine-DNA glycosylase isoform X4 n=1 Tax=Malania oleifera TaxID=397392 RepID=UPI0025ADDC15|nr:formamidopyrimidine-DNA glycosylase isoform X4 [Malania oleifera]